jgi:hypothetical protein
MKEKSTITEVVYTWPDGREEVRYRRPFESDSAIELIYMIRELQVRDGAECPYSVRHV